MGPKDGVGVGIDTYGYDEPPEDQQPPADDDREYDDDDPRGRRG